MKFDFTSILDRKGKDAIAVDLLEAPGAIPPGVTKPGFDRIPMWVADMNFPTAPSVVEAIIERAKHPAYGYFNPSKEYFDSIINWQEKRNGVHGLSETNIGYENGVLGGVSCALRVLAAQGDSILVHAPTYIGFTKVLEGNGYKIVHSYLKKDEQGVWRMDYEDMEAKIKAHKIHTAIFCSPHNPSGRVWEAWEIEKAMEVYIRNDVYVISDEIWSDFILSGHKHIPTQSVSEEAKKRTIAMYAPSKTFNLAGLVGSYHIIYDRRLKDQMDKQSALSHYNSMNVLSMHALIGAYSEEGSLWVDELCKVIEKNVDYACAFIKEHFEGVSVSRPDGTYMLFLDCEAWCEKQGKTIDWLQQAGVEAGVIWQDGRPFHGAYSIRMNLALPYSLVVEAFSRLDKYAFSCGNLSENAL